MTGAFSRHYTARRVSQRRHKGSVGYLLSLCCHSAALDSQLRATEYVLIHDKNAFERCRYHAFGTTHTSADKCHCVSSRAAECCVGPLCHASYAILRRQRPMERHSLSTFVRATTACMLHQTHHSNALCCRAKPPVSQGTWCIRSTRSRYLPSSPNSASHEGAAERYAAPTKYSAASLWTCGYSARGSVAKFPVCVCSLCRIQRTFHCPWVHLTGQLLQ